MILLGFRNIEFLNPEFLILFLLLPIIGLFYYWKKPKHSASLIMPSLAGISTARSLRSRFMFLLPLLRTLALGLIVLALARPQLSIKEETINAEGIDIMIAMDVSTSMDATDFNPNRIEVSKKMAVDFVKKRMHDRIGIVVFSGEAFTQCPLTTDHRVVSNFLRSLRTGMLEDGTAIGMGLASAVNRLKESKAKSRIVILLTDGVNNAGYIDPETSADIAAEYGIKVYTIGIGSKGLVNVRRGGRTHRMRSEIDEALLQTISEKTKGQYFHAQSEQTLQQIYDYIDQLEKTEIEVNSFTRYSEEFRMFLMWALLLLLIEYLLRQTILRSFT